MHSVAAFAALSSLALAAAQAPVPGVTGKLGDAPITTNNPAGVTYTAFLPNSNSTGVRGYVAATSSANGTGVSFNVNLYGFPSPSLGPFLYHIHDQPVPSDGNCTGTLAHLDPFVRGEMPPCDATQPQTCQVGDLSGKHGNITTSPFQAAYVDLYTSTQSGIGAFLGNRSIVVHSSNTTRLTCANFTLTSGAGSNTTVTSPTGGASTVPFTGAATTSVVGMGAVAAGVLALLL
ncbi:hypothetical protein ACLMJK_004153 [Lecanora helva]